MRLKQGYSVIYVVYASLLTPKKHYYSGLYDQPSGTLFFCAREELSMKPLQMMHSKHTHILTHIYSIRVVDISQKRC